MTWTSPVIPKLYSNDSSVNPFDVSLTEDQESWIGALLNIGAMIGPFPFGYIAERFGRKIGLLSIAIPFIISYLTLAFARNVELYYFARLLAGIAVGGGYTLLPMYVAEIAEDSNRGTLSVTLNIFWTFGNLLPYVIGPYTSILCFNLILSCIPSLFLILFFILSPESPHYLIGKNKNKEAKESLMKLRSNNQKAVLEELDNIQAGLEKTKTESSPFDLLKSKVYLKALGISLVLIIGQQLSGINAVLFYTEEIFAEAGADELAPEVSSIIIGLVLFLTSFITPFVADRLGRKLLLLVSGFGIVAANFAFGAYFFVKNTNHSDVTSISWLPIASLVVFIVMYNFGVGPIPWTISSELFPTSVKSYASALVAFMCWATSFLVTKFFEDLNADIGEGKTFWLFGGFSVLAWLFTFFFVPETRGKSFREIQQILER